MRPLLLICFCSALLLSCSEKASVVMPETSNDVLLSETRRFTPTMRSSIEGVYRVLEGNDVFGDIVAMKWSYSVAENLTDTTFALSVFSGRDVGYFVLQGGTLDSVFIFRGYWRKMVNTETGIAQFAIGSKNGGRRLFQVTPVIGKDSIVFTGSFGSGQGLPDRQVAFAYERPLYKAKRFEILGHRCGGRTSDMLPVSENSVAMVLFSPQLGLTGIEVDVRITKDGVPILYHDNQINLRETQKSGLVGTIEEYTYAQLQAFVRLIHGERIPTLQEALHAALYRTPTRFVYVDNKNSSNLALERSIQKAYMDTAAALGREFEILIGIPTEDLLNQFLTLPDYASAPSLCELSMDDTRKMGAIVWAPRWTEGTQLSNVATMHAEGRRVVTWTLDVAGYVQEYLAQGDFDGILTNYSPMVAFYHYTRQ